MIRRLVQQLDQLSAFFQDRTETNRPAEFHPRVESLENREVLATLSPAQGIIVTSGFVTTNTVTQNEIEISQVDPSNGNLVSLGKQTFDSTTFGFYSDFAISREQIYLAFNDFGNFSDPSQVPDPSTRLVRFDPSAKTFTNVGGKLTYNASDFTTATDGSLLILGRDDTYVPAVADPMQLTTFPTLSKSELVVTRIEFDPSNPSQVMNQKLLYTKALDTSGQISVTYSELELIGNNLFIGGGRVGGFQQFDPVTFQPTTVIDDDFGEVFRVNLDTSTVTTVINAKRQLVDLAVSRDDQLIATWQDATYEAQAGLYGSTQFVQNSGTDIISLVRPDNGNETILVSNKVAGFPQTAGPVAARIIGAEAFNDGIFYTEVANNNGPYAVGQSGTTLKQFDLNSKQISTVKSYPLQVLPVPNFLELGESLKPISQNIIPFTAVGATDSGVVTIYDKQSSVSTITAFSKEEAPNGTRTALADVNGDGIADLIVAAGTGGIAQVRIYDGDTQKLLTTIVAFEAGFTGGVNVAAADLNGDGLAEIIVSADNGGGPRVRVFNGGNYLQIVDFFGIEDPTFRGGARISIGDINGDGFADLIVAAGFGGGPRIAIFDGKSIGTGTTNVKLVPDFFLFEPTLRNGTFVASGDLNGDGFDDLVAGGGPGGGPRVFAISGKDLLPNGNRVELANFFSGDINNTGGVRIAVKDLDGDIFADLVAASGDNAAPQIIQYAGKGLVPNQTPTELGQLPGLSAGSRGGFYVG